MLNKLKAKGLYAFIFALAFICLWQPNIIQAKTLETKAETAIIVDFDTGKILYAKDENEALPPASMTKMMTEYIVLEQINNGDISWDTTTKISDYAYSISANNAFSGVGLRQMLITRLKICTMRWLSTLIMRQL